MELVRFYLQIYRNFNFSILGVHNPGFIMWAFPESESLNIQPLCINANAKQTQAVKTCYAWFVSVYASIHTFRWANVFPIILIAFIYEFNWKWLLCSGKPKKPLMSNLNLWYKCMYVQLMQERVSIISNIRDDVTLNDSQRSRLTLFTFTCTVLFIMRSLVWTGLHAVSHVHISINCDQNIACKFHLNIQIIISWYVPYFWHKNMQRLRSMSNEYKLS